MAENWGIRVLSIIKSQIDRSYFYSMSCSIDKRIHRIIKYTMLDSDTIISDSIITMQSIDCTILKLDPSKITLLKRYLPPIE